MAIKTPISTTHLDPEVLANLSNLAKVKAELESKLQNQKGAGAAPPPKSTIIGFEASKSGTVPFSSVFKMKPTRGYPDFPIRVYKKEDWHASIRDRIPTPTDTYHFNTSTLTEFMFALNTGGAIMLHGPTGTGKTSLVQEVCARINKPFLRVACHRHQESDAFLGRPGIVNEGGVSVTKHVHTDTTMAAMYGGMLCLDEAFRSPILMAVQPLLENPPYLTLQDCEGVSSVLSPDIDKFNIVLTDNTNGTGDNTGSYIAEAQDLSTLTRIRTAIYIDYMEQSVEKEMVSKAYPNIVESDVLKMLSIVSLIRQAFTKQVIMQVTDIRALLSWAENFTKIGDFSLAFKLAFYNKLSAADRNTVQNIWRQVTGSGL